MRHQGANLCIKSNYFFLPPVDEGQDMNPPVLDIFNKQKYNKIIVGDPNQQIYMFRGAVNALESIDATHTYHLTQRFVEFHAKITKAGYLTMLLPTIFLVYFKTSFKILWYYHALL